MATIHSTAIVDPNAVLHDGVEVGPYAIIEDKVVIGEGSVIESHARIYSGTTLGTGNRVRHSAVIGGQPQDLKYNPEDFTELVVGDNNDFCEFTSIHRSTFTNTPTRIGNNNLFMGYVHVAHDCQIGDHNVLANGATLGGHIEMSSFVLLSGNVAVHQFCRIGSYAMVAGLSGVAQDLPPYVIADGHRAEIVGLNTIGLRRHNIDQATRSEIKNAYKALYKSGLPMTKAIEQLDKEAQNPAVREIVVFFQNSPRGVINHR